MDALTRVLHVLRLQPMVFHHLSLVPPWRIERSVLRGAGFHAVDQGCCWLRMPGMAAPLALNRGDLIVVSNTAQYELLDHPDGTFVPTDTLNHRDQRGVVSTSSDIGNVTQLLCTEFRAEQEAISPLFSVMPPLIHIQGEHERFIEWLAAPLELVAFEARHDYPGKETILSHLMDILLIMVIRYWITHQRAESGGWFSALYHPQLGEVLGYIHRQPERSWTVETLADAVNMSRSSLANQFTAMVGEAPIQYLTRWRMQLAATWLTRNPQLTIEDIAQQVGYTSAYAFSKAFKRLVGLSPSDYRSQYRGDELKVLEHRQ